MIQSTTRCLSIMNSCVVLIGEQVDITNSYAVPFEEDPRSPDVWFLDHNYHEEMFAMFKKVNGE
jgi:hypothetical protein